MLGGDDLPLLAHPAQARRVGAAAVPLGEGLQLGARPGGGVRLAHALGDEREQGEPDGDDDRRDGEHPGGAGPGVGAEGGQAVVRGGDDGGEGMGQGVEHGHGDLLDEKGRV